MIRKRGCLDCGGDVSDEFFVVHSKLWEQAVGDRRAGVICVPCLEFRMGRRLVPGDFTDAPANDLSWRKSGRLLERMGPDRGLRTLVQQ